MSDPSTGSPVLAPGQGTVRAVLVPVVFFGLAAVLLADFWKFHSPIVPPPKTPAWAPDTTPVRQPDPWPEVKIGVYTYRCSECHSLINSPPETTRTLTQHREIVLRHGLNDRCFNCHNRENRDAFAADNGQPIPWDQPQLLCAKCHGPVYRDWLHGVHGRTNGYWSKEWGPMTHLKCTSCHDPHVPPFPPMKPAPPPHTLRMGDQRPYPVDPREQKNPLLIYDQLPSVRNPGATSAPSDSAPDTQTTGEHE